MSLSRAKSASAAFRNTAFGFVREHEQEESMTVPEMIKYLILNYYLLNEMFTDRLGDPDRRLHMMKPIDGIELKQTNKVARCVSKKGFYRALGTIVINQEDEGIAEFEWKLKLRSKNAHFIEIGLNDATNQLGGIQGMLCKKENGRWGCQWMKTDWKFEHFPFMNTDDMISITMRLHHESNQNAHTLSFWVDGVNVYSINPSLFVSDRVCKIRGIDINVAKQRLCVNFFGEGSAVEIVDFGIKHR